MTKFNPLSAAIGYALLAGTMTLIASPTNAQTRTTAQNEAQVLDAIVVTGTRIQSQTVTSSAPVTEIQREAFAISGATRVDDLVNQYPQLSPSFDSQTNNPSLGYATVSLRNLGAERTLTLVNGRRLPPGPAELRDISIIPAALISRVDLLTGGASAVYGSDAVAGVVNFILDTEFEGFSIGAGWSAYQHNNDNDYMQGLQRARGFAFEDGNSGFDGASRNIDIAIGGSFAEGAGHAMAWMTWRENDPLFQSQRDYASCALNAAGTRCGGSGTNATGNFYFYQPSTGAFIPASFNSAGQWRAAFGDPYNYAPLNYYQRPDERFTAGTAIKFEVNELFTPYVEAMFVNRRDSQQLAPTGTFFTTVDLACNDPILGSACSQLGLNPVDPVTVYVGRRNVEGGGRLTNTADMTYRLVFGAEGRFANGWRYDASYLYARTSNDSQGFNDWLTSRIGDALLNCPPGSFSGCQFYNVWRPGGVTASAAAALSGTSLEKTDTSMQVFNVYVSGDTGIQLPSADTSIWTAFGIESRRESYAFLADNDTAAGAFIGTGTSAPPIDAGTKVDEFFFEAAVPLFAGDGLVQSIDLDAGYRYSDYDRSGGANTYKLGLNSNLGMFRVRTGYNRAIRAPSVGDLFSQQRVALFGSADICSGSAATIAARGFTQAQCANTGVTAAQFGNVPTNPAGQNNQFIGGNTNLQPEQADTWTLGFVVSPMEDLSVAVDYYDIKIEDAITTIGAATILEFCARTGDPFLCSRIQRNPGTGDLWLSPNGRVSNLTDNFGELRAKGIDLNINYAFDALGGRFSTSFVGNYVLSQEIAPLPGVNDNATYDCTGRINPSCNVPEWRHIANVRYSFDRYSVNLRWRHFGAVDYVLNDGTPGRDAALVAARGGIGSYNYLDLSATARLLDNIEWTLGVNNIADKAPPLVGTGAGLELNANSPGGYDQLGRFIFSSINVKF